jgi:hypothetical protein
MILEDKPMAEKDIRVRVKAPFRVVDDEGNPHTDGDELSVPEAVAQQWQRSGFVEQVTAATRKG